MSSKLRLIESEYHDAIYHNNISLVEKLLDENEDLDMDLEMVNSAPILHAAQHGQWDLFTVLFERGADLDVKNHNFNYYVIHECVVNAPFKIAKAVIKESNINVQTANGETPLMLAIRNGREEVINFILETGRVHFDLTDNKSNNVLHYAALADNNTLFLKLVQKSDKLFKKNKDGKMPEALLKDEAFKLSLPQQFENIVVNNEKNENNLQEDETVEVISVKVKSIPKEIPKKINGLSTVRKMC